MPRENWTVLLVRGENDSVRQFEVSPKRLKASATFGGAVVLGLLVLLGTVGIGTSARVRSAALSHENRVLEGELDRLRVQVSTIEGHLTSLTERHAEARQLAGLDPIDAEVLEVGVGGPGTSTLSEHPLWEADSVTSKAAFATAYDLRALERRARLLDQSLSEATDSLEAHQAFMESVPSIMPSPDAVLSSRFSSARMHPIHNEVLPHQGVDLSAPEGTPILAAANGVVTWAGGMTGLGQAVRIDHGYGYMTRYGHASKILVRNGQRVERGEPIALVGKTGLATAPHLHYEVWVNGQAVNPMNFVLKALP